MHCPHCDFENPADTNFCVNCSQALHAVYAPEPVGSWAIFIGQPEHQQAWGHLLHSVRTGENAFCHIYARRRRFPFPFRVSRIGQLPQACISLKPRFGWLAFRTSYPPLA